MSWYYRNSYAEMSLVESLKRAILCSHKKDIATVIEKYISNNTHDFKVQKLTTFCSLNCISLKDITISYTILVYKYFEAKYQG